MRILIFTSDFDTGFETFIKNHYSALGKNNEVRMVFLAEDVKARKEGYVLQDKSKNIRSRIVRKLIFFIPWLKSVLLSNELDQICQQFSPDVLHFHFGSRAIRYLDQFTLSTSQPIFITFHGIDASHFFKTSKTYRNKIKRLFGQENVFPIFVSQALLDNARKYNLASSRASVCYLGVDGEFFIPHRLSEKPNDLIVFLQIGRLVEKKGQLISIRAFEKIHRELNAELHIVGDGPDQKRIQDEIEKLGLQKVVKLFPGVNKEEVKAIMNKSNFFVHPSSTPASGDMEGLPTVIMEAMAMELPILSTYHSGIPELVENGVNGFLCTENDVDQLAENMKRILDWGYLNINRSKVLNKFDLVRQNEKLFKKYNLCLNQRIN